MSELVLLPLVSLKVSSGFIRRCTPAVDANSPTPWPVCAPDRRWWPILPALASPDRVATSSF